MKIIKSSSVLIVFILLLSSCKWDELIPLPDERYPYTYYQLSQQEWEQVNSEFKSVNNHDSLFINKFGFLEGKIFLGKDAVIDASLVISETNLLFLNYSKYLGINNSTEINLPEELVTWDQFIGHSALINVNDYFETIYLLIYDQQAMMKEFYGIEYEIDTNQFVHYFFLPQSKLMGSKFESAQIDFWYFESDNSLKITENWFPKAFFPSFQIYNEKAAMKIASENFSNELDESHWTSKNANFRIWIEKTMRPFRFSDRIEIRECWKIDADDNETFKYYTILIDTQSGEVLSKMSDWVTW